MPSTYRRGSKGTIYWKSDSGQRLSTKTSNMDEAKALIRRWEERAYRSANGLIDKDMTYLEYKAEYLRGYRVLAEATNVFMVTLLKNFERITLPSEFEKLKSVRMISFTTSDIEKYLATRLQEGMAESSVSTEMQYLHPFFAKAHKRGYMARDPFEGMMKFKFCRPRGKRVIFEDAQRFIEAALPEHRLLIDFLYETGMRRTEAAIQLIENIDFERCLVRIINHTPECRCIQCERKRAKKNRLSVRKIFSALKVIGAEERIIPIRPELADRLKSYVSGRTGCVFTMHPESITRICKRLWSKINVTGKAAAHTLRHCFIDDLRRSGADDYIVKVVAGHATNTAIEDLGGSHKNYMHVDILEIQATMKHLWEWRDSQIRVRKVEESGFTIVEPVPGVHQTVHQEVSTDAANASSATT